MNYELIKSLKKAGFPMRKSYDQYKVDFTKLEKYLEVNYLFADGYWAVPTLPELIDAVQKPQKLVICIGTMFDYHPNYKEGWWHSAVYHVNVLPPTIIEQAFGETIEESVANLWLKLNEN